VDISAEANSREYYGPAGAPLTQERASDGPRLILVGVNGGTTSAHAAAYAAGMAQREHCHLAVVFVVTQSAMVGLSGAVAGAAMLAMNELAAELRGEVRGWAEELRVPTIFITRRGDPYAELRAIADEMKADVVVVGASSRIGRRVVGSIATRLVRHGRWPVMVVP
jgi:nucleotide-binding universal stress UspA family protein